MTGRTGATKKTIRTQPGPAWETKDPLTCDLPRLQPIFNNQKTNKSSKTQREKNIKAHRVLAAASSTEPLLAGTMGRCRQSSAKQDSFSMYFSAFQLKISFRNWQVHCCPFKGMHVQLMTDVSQVVYSSYICESRM